MEQEKSTENATSSPMLVKASVTFVLSYKHDAKLATEPKGNPLATHRAVVVHAERMEAALSKRYPQVNVAVANPVFLGDKDVAFNVTATMEVNADEVIAGRTRLEEMIRSELGSIEIATSLIRAGHIALQRVIKKELPNLPRIKPAPASQKEIVLIDPDGSLLVTVLKGSDDVRSHRSLLKAAEIANAYGMQVSAKFKKETFSYPALPQGATKPDWIATECSMEIGKITGFHEHSRVVEIRIGKTIHPLSVKHDEGPAYADAYRKSKFVRIHLKTARPGNPYQTDDPKFSIDETLEFTEEDVQKEMKFDDIQTDPKPDCE
jgi:hypothetical protein